MTTPTSQSLDEFLLEAAELLQSFDMYWKASHANAPGLFPMAFAAGNEGLWNEQFWEHNPSDQPMSQATAQSLDSDALIANEPSEGQSLASFVAEERSRHTAFAVQWRDAHRRSPTAYPLSLPQENLGLWYEALREFNLEDVFPTVDEAPVPSTGTGRRP